MGGMYCIAHSASETRNVINDVWGGLMWCITWHGIYSLNLRTSVFLLFCRAYMHEMLTVFPLRIERI